MSLSDKGNGRVYWKGDVEEAIEKLKEKRIEHGDCAGYIMISEKKLEEIFGKELANG